jgi:chromosome segregation ATPase
LNTDVRHLRSEQLTTMHKLDKTRELLHASRSSHASLRSEADDRIALIQGLHVAAVEEARAEMWEERGKRRRMQAEADVNKKRVDGVIAKWQGKVHELNSKVARREIVNAEMKEELENEIHELEEKLGEKRKEIKRLNVSFFTLRYTVFDHNH